MKQTVRKHITAFLLAGLLLTPQAALAQTDRAVYEACPPQYQYDDAATVKAPEDASSRYVEKDGIYVNPDAENTGKATLMITGDLMCQYRQQETQFVSSGKSYISYIAYQEILKKAVETQMAGIGTDAVDAVSSGTSSQISEDSNETQEADMIPALPDSPVSIPALDLGVIPQPEGTWDFKPSFRYVREILRKGDLVIGNLETMVSQSSPLGMQIHRLEDKPYLNAPASFLDAVKYAGYDLLTMSNNHNIDTGERGIYETLQNVEDWGFMHTGLFSSAEDPRYIIVEVNGIKIGMVSYSAFFNEKDSNLTEAGQDVLLNRYGMDKAKADIQAAREAGAEYIIGFMHWGAENTHVTTYNQEQYARTLARAGADYIIGSHPHALQRYDIIITSDGREVPVIYSMGNFLSSMQQDINNDTIILQLVLERDASGAIVTRSHRIYPATVLKSMTTKSADGTGSQTDSYIIVPQQETYRALLDSNTAEGRNNLAFMTASRERIMKVFSSRTALPLPYDPYDIEGDEPVVPPLSPKGIFNRLQWILVNRPA